MLQFLFSVSSSVVVTDLTSPIYHGFQGTQHLFSTFLSNVWFGSMTVAGYYRTNFVNGESFTRHPRYCLVFKVNIESFTRPLTKRFLKRVVDFLIMPT